MKHPEIFLLPVFMLADYFLTIYSAVLLDRRYRDFFKINQYELNPLWQKAVASKTWFNPKHLGITALATDLPPFFVPLNKLVFGRNWRAESRQLAV